MRRKILTVAAMALAGMVAGGCAATGMQQDPTAAELQGEIGDAIQGMGNVNVTVEDGVATLTGMVDDELDSVQAQMVAGNHTDISEVINLITVDSDTGGPSDDSGNADSADGDDGSGFEGDYEN